MSIADALLRELPAPRTRSLRGTLLVCAWSLNELSPQERDRVLHTLLTARSEGASTLVIEPLALSAVPWWDTWGRLVAEAGGRVDEWRLEPDLPPRLAALDDAAGFRRNHLTARSSWLAPA